MNIRQHFSMPTIAAMIGTAVHAAPAHADSIEANIANTLPAYAVIGNGSSYTQLASGAGSALAFEVVADAGVAGQVTSVSYVALASTSGAGGKYSLPSHSDSRTFSGTFHKTETLVGDYVVAGAELVSACNHLADALRAQGLGDGQIFGQDRQLALTVSVAPDASFSGPSGFMDAAEIVSSETSVTCQKWIGTTGFSPPPALSATDGVSDSNLTLIEQYGPSGLCKVVLSGVITTTAPDMDVDFRYEHHDGKQSDLKTVTTDASKTAFFSHDYSIPNGDGPEAGSIRMIGVSPSFTSNAAVYSMNCEESGPIGLQASLLPQLSLLGAPKGQLEVGGQICPTELRLTGTITGQGGGNISGQAFFVGPGFASAHQPYEVSGSQSAVLEESIALQWSAEPAQALTIGNAPAPIKTQTVVAGFNVLGSDNTEIGNVPQKPFTISCVRPAAPTVTGGGFAPQPADPPAATAIRPGIGTRSTGAAQPAIPAPPAVIRQSSPQQAAPVVAPRTGTGTAPVNDSALRAPPASVPTERAAPVPDTAAGQATGPRRHEPIVIRKPVDQPQPPATSPPRATLPSTEPAPRRASPDDGTDPNSESR